MTDRARDVLKDNFAWLKRDFEATRVLYRATLAELAANLTAGGVLPSPIEAKEAFSELCGSDVRLFAEFCSMIVSSQKELGEEAPENQNLKRVSYLRSPMTDRAFNVFSEKLGTLSAAYGADFRSICEDVYYERSDACILPLENSSDGLLMSFRRPLLKYELYIRAVCDVRQNDDSLITLALLSASPGTYGDTCEVYFPSASLGDLEKISSAVSTLGGTVTRCSTVASEYSEEADIHLCIRIPESGKRAIYYFFDALYPSHMILGNFTKFNSGKD